MTLLLLIFVLVDLLCVGSSVLLYMPLVHWGGDWRICDRIVGESAWPVPSSVNALGINLSGVPP